MIYVIYMYSFINASGRGWSDSLLNQKLVPKDLAMALSKPPICLGPPAILDLMLPCWLGSGHLEVPMANTLPISKFGVILTFSFIFRIFFLCLLAGKGFEG